MIPKETIERRRKQVEVIRSKYRTYDGRSWSEVGWHELRSMARSGNEAEALLRAGPSNIPNDGRSVGDVLSLARIDEVVSKSRQ